MEQWESVPFYITSEPAEISRNGGVASATFRFPAIEWPAASRREAVLRSASGGRRKAGPKVVMQGTRLGNPNPYFALIEHTDHDVCLRTSLGTSVWAMWPSTAIVHLAAALQDPTTPAEFRSTVADALNGVFRLHPARRRQIAAAIADRAASRNEHFQDVLNESSTAALYAIDPPFLSPEEIASGHLPTKSFPREMHGQIGNSIMEDFAGPSWREDAETRPGRPQLVSLEPDISAAGVPSQLDRLLEAERAMHLAAARSTLTARQRRIYELRYHDDLTPAEIADSLAIKVSTVYVQLRLIRERLRSAIHE